MLVNLKRKERKCCFKASSVFVWRWNGLLTVFSSRLKVKWSEAVKDLHLDSDLQVLKDIFWCAWIEKKDVEELYMDNKISHWIVCVFDSSTIVIIPDFLAQVYISSSSSGNELQCLYIFQHHSLYSNIVHAVFSVFIILFKLLNRLMTQRWRVMRERGRLLLIAK